LSISVGSRKNALAIVSAPKARTSPVRVTLIVMGVKSECAAQRARKAARSGDWQAGKRANAVRHGGTQAGKTVAVQRRKMRVQVVDL
jgi:hypothetical protein